MKYSLPNAQVNTYCIVVCAVSYVDSDKRNIPILKIAACMRRGVLFLQQGKQFRIANSLASSRRLFHHSVKLFAVSDAEFTAAKDRVGTLTQDPGNDVKLKMYALYKQATIGQCNAPKPGAFDFVGKAKWTAWNDLGSLSQDEVKQQYVNIVRELSDKKSQFHV